MDEPFSLIGSDGSGSGVDEPEEDELEFICSGPATGWTEEDSRTLERALDLAGISDPAERLRVEMGLDLLGVVILRPLVNLAEGFRAQIRAYLDQIKGGIGR